jgi:hypothetical protein
MRTVVIALGAIGFAAVTAVHQSSPDDRWPALAKESLATIAGTLTLPGLRDEV